MANKMKKSMALLLAMVMLITVPVFGTSEDELSDVDNEASLMSLFPIEEAYVNADLSVFTLEELTNISVADIFSALTYEDSGEPVEIASDATTVWCDFADENGIYDDSWDEFSLDSRINLLELIVTYRYAYAQVIVGSGNQLDTENVRMFIDWNVDFSYASFDDYLFWDLMDLDLYYALNQESVITSDTVEALYCVNDSWDEGVYDYKWNTLIEGTTVSLGRIASYYSYIDVVTKDSDGKIVFTDAAFSDTERIPGVNFDLYKKGQTAKIPYTSYNKHYAYMYNGDHIDEKYYIGVGTGIDANVSSQCEANAEYELVVSVDPDNGYGLKGVKILQGWSYDFSAIVDNVKNQLAAGKTVDQIVLNGQIQDNKISEKQLEFYHTITLCVITENSVYVEPVVINVIKNTDRIGGANCLWAKEGDSYTQAAYHYYTDVDYEEVNGVWYDNVTYELRMNQGYVDVAEYGVNFTVFDADTLIADHDNSMITKAVVGHYYSLEEAADQPDIKEQLFTVSDDPTEVLYFDDFSGDGVDFTVFTEDAIRHFTVRAIPYYTYSYTNYVGFDAYDLKNGELTLDTYLIPSDHDSYYYENYHTFLINDVTADMSNISVYGYVNGNVYKDGELQNRTNSCLPATEFSMSSQNPGLAEPVKYTVVSLDGETVENHYVMAVKKVEGPKLFVNGPTTRNVVLNEYVNEGVHDIFVANIGTEELTGLKVTLNATNVKLDDYWTVGGAGNDTLAPFTTTYDNSDNYHGELFNVCKIRLLPNGSGQISGTLTISADNQTPVVINLTGVAGECKIDTKTIPSAVQYVPYSSFITTNAGSQADKIEFVLKGGNLPEGIELTSKGELKGVPTEYGNFTFTVWAYAEGLCDSMATFTMNVTNNNDYNVNEKVDVGYEIITRVPNFKEDEDRVFEIKGAFSEFVSLWLDGVELERDIDYIAVEGSTKITVKSQTFEKLSNGTHTIAAQFNSAGTMKVASQNFTKGDVVQPSSGGGGGGGVPTYKVVFETNGGTEVKTAAVKKNNVITEVPATTKPGYEFVGWYTDSELTIPFDFATKITAATTLYARWELIIPDVAPETVQDFIDVPTDVWFFDEVKWAYDKGLMVGLNNAQFAPEDEITGSMMVTVLARFAEVDVDKYADLSFDDVAEGEWFTPYAKWAKAEGLVDEISFNPPAVVNREWMAVVLDRFLKYTKTECPVADEVIVFADADLVSAETMDSLLNLARLNIFRGKYDNKIDPLAKTTRAEFATLMHRIYNINSQDIED